MNNLEYKILLELEGEIPFTVEKGALENLDKFKVILKKHIQRSLGCKCKIKECNIKCNED